MVLLSRLATPIVPSDVRPRRARAARRAGRWPAMALACAMTALPLTGRAVYGQAAPAPAPTPATGQPSTTPPPPPASGARPPPPAAGHPAAGHPAAGQPAAGQPAAAQPAAGQPAA